MHRAAAVLGSHGDRSSLQRCSHSLDTQRSFSIADLSHSSATSSPAGNSHAPHCPRDVRAVDMSRTSNSRSPLSHRHSAALIARTRWRHCEQRHSQPAHKQRAGRSQATSAASTVDRAAPAVVVESAAHQETRQRKKHERPSSLCCVALVRLSLTFMAQRSSFAARRAPSPSIGHPLSMHLHSLLSSPPPQSACAQRILSDWKLTPSTLTTPSPHQSPPVQLG